MPTAFIRRSPHQAASLLDITCLLAVAIDDGRRLMRPPSAPPRGRLELRDWELNGWFKRVAIFLDGFCRVLAGHSPVPLHEAEAVAGAALNADGQTLGHWGLRRWHGEWELDNLELDYQLRARPEALLQALETLAREQLGPLLARWQGLLAQEPAALAWSLAG